MLKSIQALIPFFDLKVSFVTVNSSNQVVADKRLDRYAILFSEPQDLASIRVCPDVRMPDTESGILISGRDILNFNVRDHAILPTLKWYASTGFGGGSLTVVEMYYKPENLASKKDI